MKNSQEDPLISVVMATFNGSQFIAEAIQSILEQTLASFELIIVDDGSTDNTAGIVNSFDDSRIRYFKKEKNSGIAESLNLGIEKAKGYYIARMDDDDIAFPTRFEKQVKAFEEDPELILCATNSTRNKEETVLEKPYNHEEIKVRLLIGNTIVHPTVMFKKETFIKHKYRTEMVPSEDYDLWSRTISEGKFRVLGTPLLLYRYRVESETSKRRREQLALNVKIVQYVFSKLNWKDIPNHTESMRMMAAYDYNLKGRELRLFMNWFDNLQKYNKQHRTFDSKVFNREFTQQKKKYLRLYFMNKKWQDKIIPFFYLKFPDKIWIFNYYLRKTLG